MAIAEVMSKTKQMTEVERLSAKLAEAKRNVSRLERAIEVAKRKEKEAQLAERARKIKELLETNAEQPILFYCVFDDYLASIAKDVVVYQNANNCWCVKRVGEGNKWEVAIEAVEAIFVKAKI